MPAQIIRRSQVGQASRASIIIRALSAQMDQARKQEMHELQLQGELLNQSKMQIDMGIAEVEQVKQTQLLRELFETKDLRQAKLRGGVLKLGADISKTRSETQRAEDLHPFKLDEAMLNVQKQLVDLEKAGQDVSIDKQQALMEGYEWTQKQLDNRRESTLGLMEMYRKAPKQHREFIKSSLSVVAGSDPMLARLITVWDGLKLKDPFDIDKALKGVKLTGQLREQREASLRIESIKKVASGLTPKQLAEFWTNGLLEGILPKANVVYLKELLTGTKQVQIGEGKDVRFETQALFGPNEKYELGKLLQKIIKGQIQLEAGSQGGTRSSLEGMFRSNL